MTTQSTWSRFSFKKLSLKQIWSLVVFIYILIVWINPGFIGTDEYWTGITRYIPAQSSTLDHLVSQDDVKSPVQILPMYLLAQLALKCGIAKPFSQYHFVVITLGLLNFLILALSFRSWISEFKNESQEKILVFLLGFYFASPFIFTRPMFEALSAPWLSWAALFAYRYNKSSDLKNLLWGICAISISFMLRPQTGFCALVFIILPLSFRKFDHLFKACLLGALLIFLSGIPDYFLRGEWHYSLQALTLYNFKHGSEYGNQPWTFYPLMLLALSMAPLLFHKVELSWLKKYWQQFRPLFYILILFIFLHSLFAQKFERFLVPVLPVILILLTPWLDSLIEKKHFKRLCIILGLNFTLWSASSFEPAQNNIIQMARYLDLHPEIKTVFRIDNTPEWIPDVFILHPNFSFKEVNSDSIQQIALSCRDRLVISEGLALEKKLDLDQKSWVIETKFAVNMIERIAYALNPKNNIRRTELILYAPAGCE